jgi:hypothetical protein
VRINSTFGIPVRIPFTIPRVKELDALPAKERALVLSRYAENRMSLRAVSALKRLFLMAISFAIAGGVALGYIDNPASAHRPAVPIAFTCFILSGLIVIAAVTSYRLLAQRTIRGIILEQSH